MCHARCRYVGAGGGVAEKWEVGGGSVKVVGDVHPLSPIVWGERIRRVVCGGVCGMVRASGWRGQQG